MCSVKALGLVTSISALGVKQICRVMLQTNRDERFRPINCHRIAVTESALADSVTEKSTY